MTVSGSSQVLITLLSLSIGESKLQGHPNARSCEITLWRHKKRERRIITSSVHWVSFYSGIFKEDKWLITWSFGCVICLCYDFSQEERQVQTAERTLHKESQLAHCVTLDETLTLSEPQFFIPRFPRNFIMSVLFWTLESQMKKTRWSLWVSAVACIGDWRGRNPSTSHFHQ